MTISLVIKGDRAQAISACCARGVHSIVEIRPSKIHNETIILVHDHHRNEATRWFCEAPMDAPFPPGTLLWYGGTHG